jgi:ankyrin repeat protein
VRHGANIHNRDQRLSTAFLGAAMASHIAVVEYLLQQGADVNEANENGTTALRHAAEAGDLPLLEYLVDQGAAVDAQQAVSLICSCVEERGGRNAYSLACGRLLSTSRTAPLP